MHPSLMVGASSGASGGGRVWSAGGPRGVMGLVRSLRGT